jgi:hypothetical protein
MSTKAASTRMEGFVALFDIQTDFLKRALDGMSEKDMHNRLDTKANHMAWIAGSLVAQRYMMVSETNPDMKMQGAELFGMGTSIKDDATYPTNDTYQQDWDKVTPFARKALLALTDEKLDSMLDMGGMKMTFYEMVTFTMYREGSLFGQLALWRRLLDHPAMKYD